MEPTQWGQPRNTIGQALIVTAATAAALYTVWWSRRRSTSTKTSFNNNTESGAAHIAELWVHPIKGVKGFQVSEWPLVATGLQWDRHWAVVECDTGNVVSSNKHQRLAAVTAVIENQNECLVVSTPLMPTVLRVPIRGNSDDTSNYTAIPVDIFGMKGNAIAEGPEANEWFSTLLKRKVMLCRVGPTQRLPKDSPNHPGTNAPSDVINFHDYAALHIICTDGVRWLQSVLPSDCTIQLTRQQFRANIVVEGVRFPDEDTWKRITFGSLPMRVAKQSGRCVIPTHDADGNRGAGFEPTATLRRLRATPHRHQLTWATKSPYFMFGLDLFPDACGTLRVGDLLTVTERQEAPVYLDANWQDNL